MAESIGYKGHPGLWAARSRWNAEREGAAQAAAAHLREIERASSPIVVPAPRRTRKPTHPAAPAVEETTTTEES